MISHNNYVTEFVLESILDCSVSAYYAACSSTFEFMYVSTFSPLALTVQFNPNTYSVAEGEEVVLVIVLSGLADREVSLELTTVDGSAIGTYVQLRIRGRVCASHYV